jgi:hypothetical protein
MPKKKPLSKYTLITNLRTVQPMNADGSTQPLRMDAYALLLEQDYDAVIGDGPDYRMRGFGADPAWPVFSYWLTEKSFPYMLDPIQGNSMFLQGDGKLRPLFSGYRLALGDGQSFALWTENNEHELEITEFEGSILQVWDVLREKVRSHWTAPNFPNLQYMPKEYR